MALYLGGHKVRVNFGGVVCTLNFPFSVTPTPPTERGRLLSLDGYVLKDSLGRYLSPSSQSQEVLLQTSDNYILQDSSGVYLILKESDLL